jgi:hypothetical protein
MATLSRARSDGVEAVERKAAAEAVVERIEGLVMPVMTEAPDDETEEEAGPGPWRCW